MISRHNMHTVAVALSYWRNNMITDFHLRSPAFDTDDEATEHIVQDLYARGEATLCRCKRTVLKSVDGTFYCRSCRKLVDKHD